MALGVMHDLAVGVNSRGADAWSLQDSYAAGVTVGVTPMRSISTGRTGIATVAADRLAATARAHPRHGLNDLGTPAAAC
jgi:4-alpha-glucanotransferase